MPKKINLTFKNKNGFFTTNHNNTEVKLLITPSLFSKVSDSALEQLINSTNLPNIHSIIGLPDIHTGFGVPIGSVISSNYENGFISSEAVGFDINCGVRLVRTNLFLKDLSKKDLENLSKNLSKLPLGLSNEGYKISKKDLDEILNKGINWAISKKLVLSKEKKAIEYNGYFKEADSSKISKKAKDIAIKQLGTLGQGNHFIDVCVVSDIFDKNISKKWNISKNQICVFIHTGSRGLGYTVGKEYSSLFKNKKPICYEPFKSKIAQDYFKAMNACANYAFVNRSVLTQSVFNVFRNTLYLGQKELTFDLVYDLVHNLATIEKIDSKKLIVHRKGATRAFLSSDLNKFSLYNNTGAPILLPGSMLDYSYILLPTINVKQTLNTMPHGCGRLVSRSVAKSLMSYKDLKDYMLKNNILLSGRSENTAREENPKAYKKSSMVVKSLESKKLVKKIARIKPIIVLTG